MTVTVSASTDRGLKRSQNEDSLAYWTGQGPGERDPGVLLVIADGMGGSRAGEVASEMAVHAVMDFWRGTASDEPLAALHGAVETANQVVHQHSVAHPELRGMGTTCTAMWLRGSEAYVAHVGDSRAYV